MSVTVKRNRIVADCPLSMRDDGAITLYDYAHAPETEANRPEGVRFAVSYSGGVSQSSDSENPVHVEFTRKMTLYFAEETGYLSSVSMSAHRILEL